MLSKLACQSPVGEISFVKLQPYHKFQQKFIISHYLYLCMKRLGQKHLSRVKCYEHNLATISLLSPSGFLMMTQSHWQWGHATASFPFLFRAPWSRFVPFLKTENHLPLQTPLGTIWFAYKSIWQNLVLVWKLYIR